MTHNRSVSRREFVIASSCALAGAALGAGENDAAADGPVIDIHQHTNYAGRTDEQLIEHQKRMGVTTTVLLPAGKFYGLDAQCGGNLSVVSLVRRRPESFVFFANEVADLPEARREIRWFLRRGAIGIGEQKFKVSCYSPSI